MKINITPTDIEKANIARDHVRPYHAELVCPIAQSIFRTTDLRPVEVFLENVYINGVCYHLPKKATDFIKRWDNKKAVEPIEFCLAESNSMFQFPTKGEVR